MGTVPMTLEKFRKLKHRDFSNGAVLDEIEYAIELSEVVNKKLHRRRCHECGHVFFAADSIVPYCLCEKCKSQDTRRVPT